MSALSGINVLDLTHVHAGPFASMILADLGANVLKIERPEGDESRRMSLFSYGSMSAFFVASNRNKRSCVLDLREPDDRAFLDELVAAADIVIDNFRPSTLVKLGLDYESLARRNPKVISVSVTGYGTATPEADSPAYDLLAQARSGVMSLTGEPDGRPLKAGVPIGDLVAGVYAATGALAALHERDATGKGQRVEVAMLDAQVALVHYHYNYYDVAGRVLPRVGSEHQNMVPYGIYECADGYVAIAAVPEPPKFWLALCEALGRPDWTADERFATAAARLEHRAELKRALEEALRTRTRHEWFELLRAAGVPAAPVAELADLAGDEQVRAREMLVDLVSPSYGAIRLPGNPIKMRGARPVAEWTAPPELGECRDRDDVLAFFARGSSADDGDTVFNRELVAPDGAGDYALRGWRCDGCGKLSFGIRALCPHCGTGGGRETRLGATGTLQTWSRVATREGGYVIGYALIGDGDDEQTVRVFGPVDVTDEGELAVGDRLDIRFKRSQIGGTERVHHYFVPAAGPDVAGARREEAVA